MEKDAKKIAKDIVKLISDFEECSPDLWGLAEIVHSAGEEGSIEWSLHLDDEDGVKIVIETGANAVYITAENITAMKEAIDFFNSLEPKQRKVIMSILQKE